MPGPATANFRPIASARISVTTSSAATALPGSHDAQLPCDVEIYNAGPSELWFALGASGITVLSDGTGIIVPADAVRTMPARGGETHIAMICASGGSATAYVARGNGS